MFEPETEDMLPRMAPKPSPDVVSGSSESIIRPQVPEVSILFGQQDVNYQQQIFKNLMQQQNKDFPPQTYAAWKKQILPKVAYPANVNSTDSHHQENNIAMKGYICSTTHINPNQLNTSPVMNVASNVNVFGGGNGRAEVVKPLTYCRSLENCNNKCYQPIQNFQILPSQTPVGNLQHKLNQLPSSNSKEILTICAGTQTDSHFQSGSNIQAEFLSNLATKKDVENICQVLFELRTEQQRISKLLEEIAFSQCSQKAKEASCRDVSIQTDFIDMDNPANINDDIAFLQNHQGLPKNKFLEHIKTNNNMLQSPKGKPIAQSTAYRPNSPQIKNMKYDSSIYQESNKPVVVIHKSASDTSLAMNELALKYLPNEKLAELLKELNMDCPTLTAKENEPTAPNMGNFEKFGKGPSDISNASYKYLKKYRLLLENHVEIKRNAGEEGSIQNNIENQTPQYNSPQYVPNPPINQRQTPTNKRSPYAADRLPLSPLARASSSSSSSTVPQHIVDLDNIKQQPKFL